ncbi:MAG: membrane dipeptidase [Myxococcaceae bacterium]|nr:membrane dipeptidase [Myxococcaceae bacterium]
MKRALLAVSFVALLSCPHRPPDPEPTTPTTPAAPPVPLTGWVDLHTHPLSSLGFAGKLVYGGNDWAPTGGSLLPSDPDCNNDVRATTLEQALGHDRSTHGGWDFHNRCGDTIRGLVIGALQQMNNANNPPSDATGAPTFPEWPMSNDVSHQVMWVDSIRRAYDSGQRVMVALAVNNKTLADVVAGHGDGPDDDQSSADLQIAELKALVGRHNDFMEVAYSAADLNRIVAANKLAVVLGLEIDNIGNFNTVPGLTPAQIAAEITRLRSLGVRYLFPVHVIDNPFGTTAANQDIFNLSNLREAGHFWNLQCAAPSDGVTYRPTMLNPLRDPFADAQTAQMAFLMVFKLHLFSLDNPAPPPCPMDGGVVNVGATSPGLTPNGTFAVQEMMRQCMLMDVDHMSQAAANDMLSLAVSSGYPVNSGHNDVRGPLGGTTERQLTAPQYAKVQASGGMAGVGSARVDPATFVALSNEVLAALGDGGHVGFGTDSNGVSPLMGGPSPGTHVTYSATYPMSTLGARTWDFNDAGVAHYGMLSDFLEGVKQVDGGPALVANMMQGAQAFYDTWAKAEAACAALAGVDAGPPPSPPAPSGHHHHHFLKTTTEPQCPSGQLYRAACGQCLPLRANCPACEETDGGAGCVRQPECPAGRTRNHWGVCTTTASEENTRQLDLPLGVKLAKTPANQGPVVTAGKYVLTVTPHGSATSTSFVMDLSEKPAGWEVKGATVKVPATGGYVDGLWTLHWKAGKQVVTLMVRPGAELKGAFTAHKPNTKSVTGEVTLVKVRTAPKGVPGVEKLGDLF